MRLTGTLKKRTLLAAMLLGSFALATWILPQIPMRPGSYPRPETIPEFAVPGDDAFFVTSHSHELSHLVLYHDIGESIANARQADILFFGNSRQQTGLREAVIVAEARKLGLRAFTIATGHADKTRFALELIRKHDLRPRVVVASGGPFVFTEGVSGWAQAVMNMSAWDARKEWWERSVAWSTARLIHRYLPKLDFFDQRLTSRWIHYRSEETGWWRNVREPGGRFPVKMKAERGNYRNTLQLATELKQEMEARGALLVLTMVPYGSTRSGHLPYLGQELGVPVVTPSFAGMETADGSHLNRRSALKISQDFWDRFVANEEVRSKLGL
jgi:hypothetical protein